MGHIRLGRLPKSKSWSRVFAVLEGDSINPSDLAHATSIAAQQQFTALQGNRSINYCFWVLVRIVTAARTGDFSSELERLGIQTTGVTSGVGFVHQMGEAVQKGLRRRGDPTIFVRMAELSLREVLSANIVEQSNSLFGTGLKEIQAACRNISTQKRFGQVAQQFFAHFMSRSIRYITDKEISNYVGPDRALSSPDRVLKLQESLDRYCAESAKIVEEFAGGWFSKHNWETNNNIPEDATAIFTAYALQKINMELLESLE